MYGAYYLKDRDTRPQVWYYRFVNMLLPPAPSHGSHLTGPLPCYFHPPLTRVASYRPSTIPLAWRPCLSSSKHHVVSTGKVGLNLIKLIGRFSRAPSGVCLHQPGPTIRRSKGGRCVWTPTVQWLTPYTTCMVLHIFTQYPLPYLYSDSHLDLNHAPAYVL